MNRKKPTVTRSSPEVEAAIKKLREFHDIGHRSLKRMLRIGHRGYGEELAKTDGKKQV